MLDWNRYASQEMLALFSKDTKYTTWRKLWVALAKAQKQLGLPITDTQIRSLESKINSIDYKKVEELERIYHHDVMSHLHAYAELCEEARPILHMGATSAFVTDNTDALLMREGLGIIQKKLKIAIEKLAAFAKTYAALPTLSYTHLQPAQPTTVGKRACLWLQDFLFDFEDITKAKTDLRFLGVKGTTGTQASFLALFKGDSNKVKQLEELVAKEMGFKKTFTISGQTYTRKQDMRALSPLAGLAASAHKFSTDMRLLAHLGEIEEPFAKNQVGSSAMPYKRNPILCERMSSLARFLLSITENPGYTLSVQWLERSLDDSANRRLSIPQTFFSADAILELIIKVVSDTTVYPKVIRKHLENELPFMMTENILMAAVAKGKDRQKAHEALRAKSMAIIKKIKEEGAENDLISHLHNDDAIGLSSDELQTVLSSNTLTGLAEQQVETFLKEEVTPAINKKS